MKRMVLMLASIGLAGGFAVAQDQETEDDSLDEDIVTETPRDSETYDPSRDIATDEDRMPSMSLDEGRTDSPVNTDYGSEVAEDDSEDLAEDEGQLNAKAEELKGRTVLTLDGEEVGKIRQVGRNPEDGERVATIDVGRFLGVGQRTIALPLSKLNAAEGKIVRVSMMRTSLEVEPEFDESKLAPDG